MKSQRFRRKTKRKGDIKNGCYGTNLCHLAFFQQFSFSQPHVDQFLFQCFSATTHHWHCQRGGTAPRLAVSFHGVCRHSVYLSPVPFGRYRTMCMRQEAVIVHLSMERLQQVKGIERGRRRQTVLRILRNSMLGISRMAELAVSKGPTRPQPYPKRHTTQADLTLYALYVGRQGRTAQAVRGPRHSICLTKRI